MAALKWAALELDNYSGAYLQSAVMRKWLTLIVLVVALSGAVTPGVPMHSSMNEAMMDCCKKAMMSDDSPATSAARLCCALNCQESAPTTATVAQTTSISVPLTIAGGPRVTARDLNASFHGHSRSPHRRIIQPSYILNLALLI